MINSAWGPRKTNKHSMCLNYGGGALTSHIMRRLAHCAFVTCALYRLHNAKHLCRGCISIKIILRCIPRTAPL